MNIINIFKIIWFLLPLGLMILGLLCIKYSDKFLHVILVELKVEDIVRLVRLIYSTTMVIGGILGFLWSMTTVLLLS